MNKIVSIAVASRIPMITVMAASMEKNGAITGHDLSFAFPSGKKMFIAKLYGKDINDLIDITLEYLEVHSLSREVVLQVAGRELSVIGKGKVLWDISAAKGASASGHLSNFAEFA